MIHVVAHNIVRLLCCPSPFEAVERCVRIVKLAVDTLCSAAATPTCVPRRLREVLPASQPLLADVGLVRAKLCMVQALFHRGLVSMACLCTGLPETVISPVFICEHVSTRCLHVTCRLQTRTCQRINAGKSDSGTWRGFDCSAAALTACFFPMGSLHKRAEARSG